MASNGGKRKPRVLFLVIHVSSPSQGDLRGCLIVSNYATSWLSSCFFDGNYDVGPEQVLYVIVRQSGDNIKGLISIDYFVLHVFFLEINLNKGIWIIEAYPPVCEQRNLKKFPPDYPIVISSYYNKKIA